MPFEMNYTDPVGTNHPNSYWLLRTLAVDFVNQTAHLGFFGYHDLAAYESGAQQIPGSPHQYSITDPVYFLPTIGFAAAHNITSLPYATILENIAKGIAEPTVSFFSTATQLSVARPNTLEIGIEDVNKVKVVFTDSITNFVSPGDYASGVTIKVNGGAVGISAAVQDVDLKIVRYTLAVTPDANDVITWEYSRATGNISDLSGFVMGSVSARTVTNRIGTQLNFSRAENSIHLATAA